MPENFGPAGKWIHDRAHGIMEDGDTPKHIAYAIATQQAHKVGKSPKDFRTPQGVHEAKQKYDEPKSEYQKTAMLAGFFDELQKIAFGMGATAENLMPGHAHQLIPGGIPADVQAAATKHHLGEQLIKKYSPKGGSALKAAVPSALESRGTGFLSRFLRRGRG